MKKVKITGKVLLSFNQTIEVPDDELDDLLSSDDNIISNIDLDQSDWDVEEYLDLETQIFAIPQAR
jgi:hypothetical protein